MTGEHTQREDQEAAAAESPWREKENNVIEPMRTAYGKKMERLFGTSPLTESTTVPEGQADKSIGALREGTKEQYRNLFGLTRLSPEENKEFQKYINNVPYKNLIADEQGRFDLLLGKAAGLDQAEIEKMMTARQRLSDAIKRGESNSPEEEVYVQLWEKAKTQWENLSQSA